MISRRAFLKNSALFTGLATAYASLPGWMPRIALAQPYNNPKGDVLISVFLRGGADSLNMVIPYADDIYYQSRPNLAIPRPDDSTSTDRVLDIDGFFGLHPALGELLPVIHGGELAIVHATGSPNETRSHFEAMDFMERGVEENYGITSGWIGRHLATLDHDNVSPVRGIGWGTAVQQMLAGANNIVAMQSIIDYHLDGDQQLAQEMMQSLRSLYALEGGSLYDTAQATYEAVDLIQRVGYANYQPRNDARYRNDDFSSALRQTAALIRADVGLEAVCIDLGGWDTHAGQGASTGTQARLMQNLASGLSAFHQDMGDDMGRVTLVVMSEFGRRLEENGSQGTDHGHGGAMWLMSGNLAQTGVIANWAGLTPDALDMRRDLAVTIDYRDVLGELVRKRLQNPAIADVLPNHSLVELDIFA